MQRVASLPSGQWGTPTRAVLTPNEPLLWQMAIGETLQSLTHCRRSLHVFTNNQIGFGTGDIMHRKSLKPDPGKLSAAPSEEPGLQAEICDSAQRTLRRLWGASLSPAGGSVEAGLPFVFGFPQPRQ